MKLLIVILMSALLVTNTLAASMSGEFCSLASGIDTAENSVNTSNPFDMGAGIATKIVADMGVEMGVDIAADTPCHQSGEPAPANPNHCEGVCFCVHSSVQNNLGLIELAVVHLDQPSRARVSALQDELQSISVSPPRRPPKYRS